jgi:hypothetical protein
MKVIRPASALTLDCTIKDEPEGRGVQTKKKKQTPWPLVRERTIPTERLPLVDEF